MEERLEDVTDWLGEACSSLNKKARTHLLRSLGRPLLLSPLKNLAQILRTKPRISAAKSGQRERETPAQTQPV